MDKLYMLHGFMGTGGSHFAEQIPFFRENYEVIALDLPGHGASEIEANSPYFEGALEWVIAQIKERGKGYILGLSLGASLAIHVGLKEPGLLKGMILTGYSPFIPNHLKDVMEKQYKYFSNIEENDPSITNQLQKLHGEKWYQTLKKVLYSQTYHYPSVSEARLRDLQVPAIIANGSNDQHEVDAIQYLKKHSKDIKVALIPYAGHTANIDNGEIYNLIVEEFLNHH